MLLFRRVILLALALGALSSAAALADTASPAPAATPSPNPLSLSGFYRTYYFTRQNASNNPGVQFNFSPGGKYNANAVNQQSLNNAIDLHADYRFAGGGWYVGGSYFFADPFDDSCQIARTHAKGKPCVTQTPPNTNPDDTPPGYILNTFLEGYVGYKAHDVSAKVGDQLFVSPWAAPVDTRVKPAAFQGGDFIYTPRREWTFEVADMLQFEPRTSSTFQSNTLITSFPSGNQGMGSNIYFPGGGGKNTGGFFYGKIGYAPKSDVSVNGYMWDVSDIVNIYWGDARYTFSDDRFKPYVALQGGWE